MLEYVGENPLAGTINIQVDPSETGKYAHKRISAHSAFSNRLIQFPLPQMHYKNQAVSDCAEKWINVSVRLVQIVPTADEARPDAKVLERFGYSFCKLAHFKVECFQEKQDETKPRITGTRSSKRKTRHLFQIQNVISCLYNRLPLCHAKPFPTSALFTL